MSVTIAVYRLTAYNLGGVLGAPACAMAVARYGLRVPLLLCCIGGAASAWLILGVDLKHQTTLLILGLGLHGLFVNAVQSTMYALCAYVYSTGVRATAAAPTYLDRRGRPAHPRDLLGHACLRGRFASGTMPAWEYERDGEVVRVEPSGPLVVQIGGAVDLVVDAACAGLGIVHLYEDWLRPHLASGALEPVLDGWWRPFSGPYLYYPGRRFVPAPLRALLDFIKADAGY